MAASLPPVSAKLVADAEQFINEFRRAERAAQGSTNKIGSEVDRMAASLSKKFSLSDVGKDVLRGFGLGSGFAVAQQAAELLVGTYREAAEAAKSIEASTAATLASLERQLAARRTPEQELNKLLKDRARMYNELTELKTNRTEMVPVGGNLNMRWEERVIPQTNEQQERIAELTAQLQKLDDVINPTRAKVVDNALAEFFGPLDEVQSKLAVARDNAAKASDRAAAAAEKEADSLAKSAEQYLLMIDPTKRYTDQLEEIETLFWAGHLSAEAAAASIDKVNEAMANDQSRRVDNALNDFFAPLDAAHDAILEKSKDTTGAAKELGWAFQSSFENAILEGEKLSDVLDGLIKDILKIAIRSAITEPLGKAIGGFFSGVPSLLGFAAGGRPPVGVPSIVGENGAEVFVPDTAGTIIPNHELGGGGESNITFVYNFASGVQRSEIMPMLKMQERSIISRIVDAQRRGKQLSPAY